MNESATEIIVNTSAGWPVIITAAITLIIAFITAWVAYVNYHTRPILSQLREKHSEALKDILRDFHAALTLRGWENIVIDSHLPHSLHPDILYPTIEKNLLFRDLPNHLPSGLNVVMQWTIFRDSYIEYNEKRSALLNKIVGDLGNMPDSLPFSKLIIKEAVAKGLYEEAVRFAANEEPLCTEEVLDYSFQKEETSNYITTKGDWPDLYSLVVNGETWVEKISKEGIDESVKYLGQLFSNLAVGGTNESQYIKDAKSIRAHELSLIKANRELRQNVEEILAIPILPGDCKHIKRASMPVFPFRQLDWFRSKVKSIINSSEGI